MNSTIITSAHAGCVDVTSTYAHPNRYALGSCSCSERNAEEAQARHVQCQWCGSCMKACTFADHVPICSCTCLPPTKKRDHGMMQAASPCEPLRLAFCIRDGCVLGALNACVFTVLAVENRCFCNVCNRVCLSLVMHRTEFLVYRHC
jgi:hypothetical protein